MLAEAEMPSPRSVSKRARAEEDSHLVQQPLSFEIGDRPVNKPAGHGNRQLLLGEVWSTLLYVKASSWNCRSKLGACLGPHSDCCCGRGNPGVALCFQLSWVDWGPARPLHCNCGLAVHIIPAGIIA